MQEEMLKTSWKQRLIIVLIAALLLGSSVAVYVGIIVGGGKVSTADRLDVIIAEYTAKQDEIAKDLSGVYFDQLKGYQSEVKSYNATAANSNGLRTRDLKVGDGAEITAEDTDYYAYYIGFCPDESVFDSSFDSQDNPTSLKAPLDVASQNLIEGWNAGMVGAKVGGVRELTIPSDLAYKDQEICGAANSPLKFIVMTVAPSEDIAKKYDELDEIYQRYVEAYYEYYLEQQAASSSADTGDTDTEASE